MAGIGFVLQRVLQKGGVTSYIKVALSGIMIVAGPWIFSILGLTAISNFSNLALTEAPTLFTGVIVYSYAFSLVIFSGFHFIFTRLIADMLYEEKVNQASSILIVFSIAALISSIILSFFAVLNINVEHIAQPFLFKFSVMLLFCSLNIIWLLMMFITLLKEFVKILVIYLIGQGAAFLLVFLLAQTLALGGAMLGFALGHLIIVILLYILAFKNFRPDWRFKIGKKIFSYFSKFKLLFLTGAFYYAAIWADKMMNWFVKGAPIGDSFIKLFENYDIAVYYANLSMIPGLVYFVIVSETNFYVLLRRFLVSIGKSKYTDILQKKYKMIKGLKKGILDQSYLQGIITLSLVILSPQLVDFVMPGSDPIVLQIILVAIFFNLLFLTILNFLMYMEAYLFSFLSCLIYFVINIAANFVVYNLPIDFIPGISFLIAGMIASGFGAYWLFHSAKHLDRKILQ